MHRPRHRLGVLAAAVLATATTLACASGPAGAAPAAAPATVEQDLKAFTTYTGSTPLSQLAPGTVIRTRDILYTFFGLPLPVKVTQVAFRTTDAQGHAEVAVTSVAHSPVADSTDKAVAYQSFYDSLNPEDGPAYAIAGGKTGDTIGLTTAETPVIAPFLAGGYAVIISDIEGPNADFAAGPEYGTVTLDGIRAAGNASSATGVSPTAKIGLAGYSGGAIGTDWAAALAPSYAPDVNRRLVGAAEGGLLVEPSHNLSYVSGSSYWSGVLAMALIGVSRAYGIDVTPYLNDYGKSLFAKLATAKIDDVLGNYPGLTWQKIADPRYPTPESVPVYVQLVNKLNLGTQPTPTIPMLISQGTGGTSDGTSGSTPGIGAGDGVMIAGDVRTLARQYCAAGTSVSYQELPFDHTLTAIAFLPGAYSWLSDRFAGKAAPSSCGSIAAGNPLTPDQPAS